MGTAAGNDVAVAWWRAVAERFARFVAVGTVTRRTKPESRKTRKFQAVLTFLPATGGVDPARLAWPWRAVVRARDHATRVGQLLTALVSSDDGGPPPGKANVIVTMVVVGASPDNCLDVGDAFTLWRGSDIARGVITRRLYV
jgi:hypothetical protein